MEFLAKVSSSGGPRDKINRFIQYYCKFIVFVGTKRGWEQETLARLAGLMAALGCTRKAMRIGKQAEHFVAIKKSIMTEKDDTIKILSIVKSSGLALWLVMDTLGWLNTAKVIKLEQAKDISKRGNQYWLTALVASLFLNMYKLGWNRIKLGQEKSNKAQTLGETKGQSADRIKALIKEKATLKFSALSDLIDCFIPAVSLEIVQADPGWAGLAGAVTSLMGLYTALKPLL